VINTHDRPPAPASQERERGGSLAAAGLGHGLGTGKLVRTRESRAELRRRSQQVSDKDWVAVPRQLHAQRLNIMGGWSGCSNTGARGPAADQGGRRRRQRRGLRVIAATWLGEPASQRSVPRCRHAGSWGTVTHPAVLRRQHGHLLPTDAAAILSEHVGQRWWLSRKRPPQSGGADVCAQWIADCLSKLVRCSGGS
jgi:hypothetical protein